MSRMELERSPLFLSSTFLRASSIGFSGIAGGCLASLPDGEEVVGGALDVSDDSTMGDDVTGPVGVEASPSSFVPAVD